MATQIDSNSVEGVFLTLTRQTPLKATIDNLWYNSGWARTAPCSQGYQWPGCSRLLTHLRLDPVAPFWGDFHFLTSQPELSYSALRSATSGWPAKCQACVQNDIEGSRSRSLIDIDRDSSTPKTSLPCCFTVDIPPGLNSLLTLGYFPR
jgi:hypothetical protein